MSKLLRRTFLEELQILIGYLPRGRVWDSARFSQGGTRTGAYSGGDLNNRLVVEVRSTGFAVDTISAGTVFDNPQTGNRFTVQATVVASKLSDQIFRLETLDATLGLRKCTLDNPTLGNIYTNIAVTIANAFNANYNTIFIDGDDGLTDKKYIAGSGGKEFTWITLPGTDIPLESSSAAFFTADAAKGIAVCVVEADEVGEAQNLVEDTPMRLVSLPDIVFPPQAGDISVMGPPLVGLDGGTDATTSNLRLILRGLSYEMERADELLDIFREEYPIKSVVRLLAEWEVALGIPDDCFSGRGTFDERKRDVITKIAALGVQTADDFVELAAVFGVTVTVEGGTLHPELVYPGGTKEQNHTIVISFFAPDLRAFDYGTGADPGFPVPFLDPDIGIAQCLFDKLKPANCNVRYLFFPTA